MQSDGVPNEYLRWREEQSRKAVARAEEFEREQNMRRSMASLPAAFDWCMFGYSELADRCGGEDAVNRASDALTQVMARKATGVVLVGPAGCGKTSLACAMVRRAASQGVHHCVFTDAYAIARAYRNTRMGTVPRLIEETEHAFLLVVDDLGSEKGDVETIRELIHDRHAEGKPTIITTWMTQDQLRERYGDGTARRIFERGITVDLGGAR